MKYLTIIFILLVSCKDLQKTEKTEHDNVTTQNNIYHDTSKNVKKKYEKYFESDVVEHYFINISENDILKIGKKNSPTKEEKLKRNLFISGYPQTIVENNFEENLKKFKFKKEVFTEVKKKELDNIFCEKDSSQTSFSSCIPYYRDILIFKKDNKTVGIAKVCFGCGIIQFTGSKINTQGFGIDSDRKKLEKLLKK